MSQPLVDGGVGEVSITLPSERNQILDYIGRYLSNDNEIFSNFQSCATLVQFDSGLFENFQIQ